MISLFLSKEKYIKENKYNTFTFYILVLNQCIHVNAIYNEKNTKYEEIFLLLSELCYNCALFLFLNANKLLTLFEVVFPLSYLMLQKLLMY